MTPPTRIGAVVIPRPWTSDGDLRRLQGLDLHEMDRAELERERRRLDAALGIASDRQLGESMYVLWGAAPLTVEQYLEARLALVGQLLKSRGGVR
jgi:hypothetical protein